VISDESQALPIWDAYLPVLPLALSSRPQGGIYGRRRKRVWGKGRIVLLLPCSITAPPTDPSRMTRLESLPATGSPTAVPTIVPSLAVGMTTTEGVQDPSPGRGSCFVEKEPNQESCPVRGRSLRPPKRGFSIAYPYLSHRLPIGSPYMGTVRRRYGGAIGKVDRYPG
jgi:hypothetical protein